MAALFRAAFDGGSRGNPGIAAWGVAVLDENGDCVEGHAGYIGRATNNVAEYNGLLAALDLAVASGAEKVRILADSELIVRQIKGIYRVKNAGLKPLYARARTLIRRIPDFRIDHVRRGENKEADRLVNEALDRAAENPSDTDIRVFETAKATGTES